MRIAIIGAGAIGTLVAGYLADKNEKVILVAHPEQEAAIAKNGLTIEGVRGRLNVKLPVKSKLDEQVGIVILATKTQDLGKAIAENLDYLKDTCLLTIQNGIKAEELIAQKFDQESLFASIVMFGATYLAPGRVVHNFEGDWILGRINSGAKKDLDEVRQITSKIFPSPLSEDIMGMKWVKLFINANNCLPAILGKSMQQTFRNTAICKISLGIWQEGWTLVNKAKIKLSSLPNFSLERITGLISLPSDKAAKIFSNTMTNLSKQPLYGSILQSIKRKRTSEVDYINGEFVRLAQNIGSRAALNEKLVQMVHSVEDNQRFFSEEELISQTKEYLP